MESFATLAQAIPTGRVRQPRDRRTSCRACSPPPGAATTFASFRASCSWSRPISTPAPRSRSARTSTRTCRSRARSKRRARCRACSRRSRSTAQHYVDGALNKTLHASVALDEGVALLLCVNPLVPFDASAAQGRGRARRQAQPGRAAAGARPDVPRDDPLAHAGRHGALSRAVPGCEHRAVRARPRGRRHVLRQHLQLLAAQAPVRPRVRQDAAQPRRARASAGARVPRATASRSAATAWPTARARCRRAHRSAPAAPRPGAAHRARRPRASSRTRSTSSSGQWPRRADPPARWRSANPRAAPASASSRRASRCSIARASRTSRRRTSPTR